MTSAIRQDVVSINRKLSHEYNIKRYKDCILYAIWLKPISSYETKSKLPQDCVMGITNSIRLYRITFSWMLQYDFDNYEKKKNGTILIIENYCPLVGCWHSKLFIRVGRRGSISILYSHAVTRLQSILVIMCLPCIILLQQSIEQGKGFYPSPLS